MLDTTPLLIETDFPKLRRVQLTTLQLNLGYLCNLSCTHCHVNAGPRRTELMGRETMEAVLNFVAKKSIKMVDLTGGAPEMNPHFRYLVECLREMEVQVIDRCNLTILLQPGYEDLASFLAEHQVAITASLPCYQEQNVSEQRGKGVYEDSIKALQALNKLGYGIEEGLLLNLVYNPNGAFLPPSQNVLQEDYKRELFEAHGIQFNELLTITNMPISRFGSVLLSKKHFSEYMTLLKDNFSERNLGSVMCRSLISVDWQGYVYDCDFNQMLAWPMRLKDRVIVTDRVAWHVSELLDKTLEGSDIVIGDHCYGCTAGQGSSCGGALE